MQQIRWGMIGCGDVTEVKSGPGFQKADGSELVAVMRRNGALAADYARRHRVPRWYDNAEALLGDPDVDAVYIATPPSSHKEYTLAAARAGKSVYVEKPMALNYAECLEMIETCERAGVPLFVAYYRRAQARFLKVKELLDEGAIGEVRLADVALYQNRQEMDRENLPWRVRPEIAGGGFFFDMACHTIDLLMYWLGPIAKAKGFASNQAGLYEAEDLVSGAFEFESGAHGCGRWCFTAWQDRDEGEIVGSKGSITFSTFGPEPIRLVTPRGREEFWIDPPAHVEQPMIQAVVDELLGRGKCPSTGRTGAETNRVMELLTRPHSTRSQ